MRVEPREENITETRICRSLFNSQQSQRKSETKEKRGKERFYKIAKRSCSRKPCR